MAEMRFYAYFVVFIFSLVILQNECIINGDNHDDNSMFPAPNPDSYLATPEIIGRHGYPAESHTIQTEDGYLLQYHRIPHGKHIPAATQKYPILLFHALLTNSAVWVINGPEKGLAYRLADEGYDVWLANVRGNTYSISHIKLNPTTDKSFWNFSFHEAGNYDLPAAVDYILQTTGAEKIIYVGFSLGTATFFTFMIGRPAYAEKILVQINIAPVGALSHTTSPFKLFVPLTKQIQMIPGSYNWGSLAQHDELTNLLLKTVCGPTILNYNVCKQSVLFFLMGEDEEQFNNTLMPVITNIIPAGTSVKNMLHFVQQIGSGGRFEYYNYGSENVARYGSSTPPTYNIGAISVPMKFFCSKNDILADLIDAEILYQQVSKPMGLTVIEFDKWNHVDYMLAIDVNKYFNNIFLEFLSNVTTKPDFIAETVANELCDRRRKTSPQNSQPGATNVENFVHNKYTSFVNSINNLLNMFSPH